MCLHICLSCVNTPIHYLSTVFICTSRARGGPVQEGADNEGSDLLQLPGCKRHGILGFAEGNHIPAVSIINTLILTIKVVHSFKIIASKQQRLENQHQDTHLCKKYLVHF